MNISKFLLINSLWKVTKFTDIILMVLNKIFNINFEGIKHIYFSFSVDNFRNLHTSNGSIIIYLGTHTNFPEWKWKSLNRVWLFVTPWTIQSMEFSRPAYWSGQPFPSSRRSSQHRDWTQISCIAGRFFTMWAARESHWTRFKFCLKFLLPWL